MKRNMLRKMLIVGILILFFGTIVQPVTSIDTIQDIEIESNDLSDDSTFNENCNCPYVDSSGKPICDKLEQMMESNAKKMDEVAELIEQYKNNPIRGRLYLYYMLILLTKDVYLNIMWAWFNCFDE